MLTCKSPRTVMRLAYAMGKDALPRYSSRFSRKDFTLPQLFACLVVKEQMRLSYRRAEALLRDCSEWCQMIGMAKAPDHNTLCRAARLLMCMKYVDRMLDLMTRWAAQARLLRLSTHPLSVDSTSYESHHVSRHYEQRCMETRKRMRAKDREKGHKRTRSQSIRRLPKLGIAVASGSHFVTSLWTGTGAGSDHPHYRPLVRSAQRRIGRRGVQGGGGRGLRF